jgi:hypothetical protein
MNRREQLSDIFHNTLGVKNVYFQPPTNTQIKYPCIVYKLLGWSNRRADDISYTRQQRWQVTYITKDPDSPVPESFFDVFQMCSHQNRFTSDNLYHDVFNIYY